MREFEIGSVIYEPSVEGARWKVVVSSVYNPSDSELEANQRHNDSLGNWEPERELPTERQVYLSVVSETGEKFQLHWTPSSKILGPHVSRRGWSKAMFNNVKSQLLNWKVSA